jgi:hypothetical protein
MPPCELSPRRGDCSENGTFDAKWREMPPGRHKSLCTPVFGGSAVSLWPTTRWEAIATSAEIAHRRIMSTQRRSSPHTIRTLRLARLLVQARSRRRRSSWHASFVSEVERMVPEKEMLICSVERRPPGHRLWGLREDSGRHRGVLPDRPGAAGLARLLSNCVDFGKMHLKSMVRLFDGPGARRAP